MGILQRLTFGLKIRLHLTPHLFIVTFIYLKIAPSWKKNLYNMVGDNFEKSL